MSENTNESRDYATIPYYVHEGEVARLERTNKRLWIAVIVIFVAFVLANLAWVIYEHQFEDVVYTYEIQQDSGEGGNNQYTGNRIVIGGDDYGQADHQSPGDETSHQDQ